MLPQTTLVLTSQVHEGGKIVAALTDMPLPAPGENDVVIAVEAAPINPSDLGLLFSSARIDDAVFAPGQVEAPVSPAGMAALAGRISEVMPVGSEGAGTVIAAGSGAAAQALVGKRVATVAGGMYARHRVVPAASCMVLPEGTSARDGAAAFVNPLTAVGFVETLRSVGGKGIIHTAAASNLGQMLVRLCAAEGIPLVNVVRKAEQADLLKGIGAAHVLDSASPTFREDLRQALEATGADTVFDAIGGGPVLGTILSTMEQVGRAAAGAYSRYGSTAKKRAYVYGMLDTGPITLPRDIGFVWDVSGWLLFPRMEELGPEVRARMQARVGQDLTTIFASNYKTQVPLSRVLDEDVVRDFTRRATGSKYLILPQE
ncbi:zinc-binding dehydrogenase [Novosphingobium sp. SG720]|uniref:zinc-binding dehydrogenase n=1 Tax=Novosphingobium sp. SG720 TaxID=2586998 RepID=UPI001446B466|nr:zinc-binding dehydrogenase [Novosphingobium sp. SG720]NKJ44276.1 NADPH:quinone reductase-like Zn-dependent oxidoreductase [Novosphingobium sp. SG720]